MRDALKNYLALASGVTDVGRQRALAASKALVAQGEATAEQVTSLAEDLLESSKQNRALITSLVRSEIEKAMNRLGLATADEVQRLTRRLQSVESALRDASGSDRAAAGTRSATATPAAAKPATARPVGTKPAAATPAAAKPAAKPPVKAAAKKPAATKAAAKKPAASKAPAKKARAAKAPAKKAATKPVARKSAKPAAKKAPRTSARKATP